MSADDVVLVCLIVAASTAVGCMIVAAVLIIKR